MNRLQRVTYRVWLAVGVVVLVSVTIYLAYRPLAIVLAPILFALLIVYLLNPVVVTLERRGLPRLLGTATAYLLVIATGALLTMAVLPLLSRQIADFAREAPDLGAGLATALSDVADQVGLTVDVDSLVDTQELGQRLQQFVTEAENRDAVVALLVGLSGLARGAFLVLLTLGLGPVIAFYVLVDLPRFRSIVRNLVPPRHRDEVAEISQKLATVVGGFVRGQLIIAVFVGVAASVVLGIIGLRFWLVVGVIAGVTNLVPLLGPWVAGMLGFTIALLTEGFGFAVLVAVAMTGVQQLDSNLLSPLIMGRSVRIHPLAVLLAILVSASLYGVFGMLVAVPLVAGAKVLVQHLWQTRVPWAEGADGDALEVDRPVVQGAEQPPGAPAVAEPQVRVPDRGATGD